MHLQPMPVGLEPLPHFGVLMVGGVVLNHDGPLATISPSQLFEEAEVGTGVEDGVLPIIEPRAPKFDGSEDLRALALSGDGNHPRGSR